MKFNFEWYDLRASASMERNASLIQALYNLAIQELSRLSINLNIHPDKPFSFDQFPSVKKKVDQIFMDLADEVNMNISNGTLDAWTLGNAKNDALLQFLFKSTGISKEVLTSRYSFGARNMDALKAFQTRKDAGMTISEKVWQYTQQAKTEIEQAIDVALTEGKSAANLSRDVRELLQNPDNLFRRVRDKGGALRLSKAAKAFKPGQGVYRSSYKNAMRLARTETNMAYRKSDFLRWSSMSFVKGIEVKLSNNPHHCPTCEQLKGKYPKEFKFIGWHPQCRCFAIPILASDQEFQKLINEEIETPANPVTDLPESFNNWYEANKDKIQKAKSKPYFLRENKSFF